MDRRRTKAKAPAADGKADRAVKGAQTKRQCSAASPSCKGQNALVLAALRRGPRDTEQLRRLGVYQPAVRVAELRGLGYSIETTRITLTDRDGYLHTGCALYELIREPGGD